MTPAPRPAPRLGRLNPLRPDLTAGVMSAALTLGLAEFVRNGLYAAYLTQVIDTRFGLPLAAAASAWTVHLVADTLMRGPAGALINRFGLRAVMFAGAALSLLAVALLPLAHHLWLLLLLSALHGVGFSAMWPGTMNLTADAAREGYQGRALTFVNVAVTPLIGAGVLVYGALAGRGDSVPLTLAIGIQAGATLLSLLVPRQRPMQGESGAVATPRLPTAQLARQLAPLLPAAFMQTLTLTLLGLWLFRIAPGLGLDYWGLVGLLVTGGVAAFAAMPLTGKVADGGRALLAVTLGYALVGAALAGFVLKPPVAVMYLLGPLAGVGYAFLAPGWAALVTRVLPEAQRPAAWGVLMSVENIGVALGPLLGALAYDHLGGATGPFKVSAALALLTSLGYVLFRHAFRESPASADAEPAWNAGRRTGHD